MGCSDQGPKTPTRAGHGRQAARADPVARSWRADRLTQRGRAAARRRHRDGPAGRTHPGARGTFGGPPRSRGRLLWHATGRGRARTFNRRIPARARIRTPRIATNAVAARLRDRAGGGALRGQCAAGGGPGASRTSRPLRLERGAHRIREGAARLVIEDGGKAADRAPLPRYPSPLCAFRRTSGFHRSLRGVEAWKAGRRRILQAILGQDEELAQFEAERYRRLVLSRLRKRGDADRE